MAPRILGCFFVVFAASFPMHSAAQTESTGPVYSLRAGVNLVVEDVVVTDTHGNPIHNLAASDFTILENGHPQKVKNFAEHMTETPKPMPPLPQFQPGTYTNDSVMPAEGVLNIILIDKLNTPLDAQGTVSNELLKYLKGPLTGSRIAIFSLTTQLRLLQGFTSDPAVLRALVEGKKGLPGGSPVHTDSVAASDAGADNSFANATSASLGDSPDATMMLSNIADLKAEQQSFQLMQRAHFTLDAFNQLARYLSTLPGRKNVIWFSGAFPISVQPDGDSQDPFAAVASSEDEYRETVNLLARSQVAVYPVDARGLMGVPMQSAANSNRNTIKDPMAYSKSQQKFFVNTTAEHNMMTQMAEATGGEAFVDTNDLKAAVSKAIETGSNYYTITYSPTETGAGDSYRKIDVKLDRSGTKLLYRHGYFTDAPTETAHHETVPAANSELPGYSYIHSSMLHGAPDSQELIFVANVRPSTTAPESDLAPGNQGNPKVTGPYRRYTVTFVTNPRAISCSASGDGNHHCILEFISFVYGADGTLINTENNGLDSTFSAERYAAFEKSQLYTYRQQISVPVKGEYYLRVGIHDDNSGKVGTLELPIAAVARLPAAPPPPPAPTGVPK